VTAPTILEVGGKPLCLARLRQAWKGPTQVKLTEECYQRLEASAATIQEIIRKGSTVYGVNTGFGLLARTRIDEHQLAELQRNLVMSHSVGVGGLLEDQVVRLILVLKIIGLSRGHSGVRPQLVATLQRLLECEIYPCIPAKGSVGASGDLAPLAHLSAVLLGVGQARHRGEVLEATEALQVAGLEPFELAAKEGLALLNGTQVSTALALSGLFASENLLAAAVVAGALSVDAARGSDTPFDARIHEVRGQQGQIDVAAAYRRLLTKSAIRHSHRDCKRVQDPYSLRCQPQVMGACLDTMRFVCKTLVTEANAVTDNPVVFADSGDVLSGGNFHAEPIAMASDTLALAIAELGSLSERRTALLLDANLSELPAFLVEKGGLNSGFMMAQVTSAALVSENKTFAHPASVDSIPTSANQEDHVSMATFAARRLGEMATNSMTVVAIELLAAAQGIEFHRPLLTSPLLQIPLASIRRQVPPYDRDRYFAPDIAEILTLVTAGTFRDFMVDHDLCLHVW
jgi:histidine ammonia-lyase